MKLLIVLLSVVLCASDVLRTNLELKYKNENMVDEFLTAFNAFTIDLYKKAANRSNNFFVLSPQAVWITLAAIAEGAGVNTQRELFQLLNLPQSSSTRQKYYQIATSRIFPTLYVNIFNTRSIVVDQTARINTNWYQLVKKNSLLQVISAPLKDDRARTKKIIKHFILLEDIPLKINGHSLLLNSIDYSGLWTTAFRNAMIIRAPFYNMDGKQIGSVDLMKDKRRVRFGYVDSLNAKFLELPIGKNGEYKMVFALSVNNNSNISPMMAKLNNRTMFEVVASLQDSYLPIDIAIPRMVFSSNIDMKQFLKDLGIINLWQEPMATRFISTHSYTHAYPASYIQRATLTMDKAGVNPPTLDYHMFLRSSAKRPHYGDFVADRPFMFGLFDAETYTCLMAAMFTKPTYPY